MDYAYFYYKVLAPGTTSIISGEDILATKVFTSSSMVQNIGIECCEGVIRIMTPGTYEITYSIVGADSGIDQIIQMTNITGGSIIPGSDMLFTGTNLLSQSVTFLTTFAIGDEITISNNTFGGGQVNLQLGSLIGITIEQIA